MNLVPKLLVVLTIGLGAAGLILGLAVPVHADGQTCGSAFSSANAFEKPACADRQADERRTPILLLALAGASALGALVASNELKGREALNPEP